MEIPELDRTGLRRFGLILGAILALLFGLLLPWTGQERPAIVWVGTGLLVMAWALVAPDSMNSLYRPWMRVAMMIGSVVNATVLAIVFFMVITPMGMIMRMMGKDPMRRKLDKSLASYRMISKVRADNHVERPF